MAKKHVIVVKVSSELAARVAKRAKEARTTTSAVVRQALERELSAVDDSLADIRDLVGAAHGPGDLSTNKKYLAGYGRS